MLKKYFIVILLMAAMCSPAFAGESCRQSDSVGKEIKKSAIAIGQAFKEAGTIIGQNFKKIGKQTGKAFKDTDKALRDTARKESI